MSNDNQGNYPGEGHYYSQDPQTGRTSREKLPGQPPKRRRVMTIVVLVLLALVIILGATTVLALRYITATPQRSSITPAPTATSPTGGVATSVPTSPPIASPATNSAIPSSAMCVFEAGVTQSCQSTNPHIVLNFHNTGDTSQCTFAVQVNWGDGNAVQDFTIPGGPNGPEHLSDRIYSASSGTYQIEATGSVLSGSCTFTPASYQFTLLAS